MIVTVSPDPFHLVQYQASVIRGIIEDVAAQIDWPTNIDISLTVDEQLPMPILGTFADVVADGTRAEVWISGGNFEARDKSREFSELHARAEITHVLLRAKDRVGDAFAAAPPEGSLTLGERCAWDTYTWGRCVRLGHPVHHQKRLYDFRMQHGFSDAADAAFDRLWAAESMTWDGIREICVETGAVDRPKPKTPIDLLRQGV